MRLGSLEFRPGLLPTLVTILLLGLLASLGFWQLDRAEQTRALLDRYHEQSRTVIRLEPQLRLFDELQFRMAEAYGSYDSDHQFLLDNMTHNGSAGYHVLTPFRLRGSEYAVLVNRGWIPLGPRRGELPDADVDPMPRQIVGRIRLPAEEGFMLGEEEGRDGWPYRVQRIDLGKLEQELAYPLMPVVLLLDNRAPDGFVREWKPVRYGPERNIGYAVQWFGLALTLLIIYLVVNTRKAK